MEGKLEELSHLLNQAVKEKYFLQGEVKRLAFDNMELYDDKQKKSQITPEDVQDIQIKVFFIFYKKKILKLKLKS